jgi:hypothetical protein
MMTRPLEICVAHIVIALSFPLVVQVSEGTLALQMIVSNQSNNTGVDEETKLGTEDLNSGEHTVTQEMIVNELHDLGPEEIATYPFNELPPQDIVIIFNSLSVSDLEKTLSSISPDNLREIFAKLPQVEVSQILNRLPEAKGQEILDLTNPSS